MVSFIDRIQRNLTKCQEKVKANKLTINLRLIAREGEEGVKTGEGRNKGIW